MTQVKAKLIYKFQPGIVAAAQHCHITARLIDLPHADPIYAAGPDWKSAMKALNTAIELYLCTPKNGVVTLDIFGVF